MKKTLLCVCLFLCSLSFICCVDVVQHVTRKNDGTEKNIISFTFSKAMFEMAKAMGGDSSSFDYNDFLDEFGDSDSLEYDGFSAKLTKIDNDFSVGYLFDMSIDYKDKNIQEKLLTDAEIAPLPIPRYEKNKMVIYLGFLNEKNSASSNNEEMGMAFLASAVYRLLVSKKCMPQISRIVLKSATQNMNIGYADFYDEYLIEVPIPLLVAEKCRIELYK